MGRGLSKQQIDILGYAAAVNRFTNRGQFRVKHGKKITYDSLLPWRRLIDYPGVCDITYRLAEHWVYSLPFLSDNLIIERTQKLRDGTIEKQSYEMRHCKTWMGRRTGKRAVAKTSIKRSIKGLIERGLMVQTEGESYDFFDSIWITEGDRYECHCGNGERLALSFCWGSVLTEAGLEIGIENIREPSDLQECVNKLYYFQPYNIARIDESVFHLSDVLACPNVGQIIKKEIEERLEKYSVFNEDSAP
jgi:hypothetical protein